MSSIPVKTPGQGSQQTAAPEFAQGARQRPINNRMRYGPGNIPPYPLIGEAFIEYATTQQRAVRTGAYLAEQHNMEIDVFGYARFHQRSDPFESQAETTGTAPTYPFGRRTESTGTAPTYPVGRQAESTGNPTAQTYPVGRRAESTGTAPTYDVETAQAATAEPNLETSDTFLKHGEGSYEDMGDTQRLIPFKPGSSEIVSENNPRFRNVARRLEQLQRSSGVAPIPTPQFRQPFAPSYMALERKGLAEQPRNPNSNYLGHSAKQDRQKVPDYLNCGLWLYGLHPETTVEDLLGENGAIKTGVVYALNLVPPQNGYPTAAASLYFMRHSGAALFLEQAYSTSGIRIRNERIKAKYNQHGQEEYPYLDRSRVLKIRGPAEVMTREFWEAFFRECVEYQLSHVRQRWEGGHISIEFGFARVDGQAYSLMIAIEKQEKFRGILKVEFAPDPCDPSLPGL